MPPIESTIEIAASPDRRPRLHDRPHTVRRVARRRGERLDGQVQLGLLVSAAWRASRCRDVGLVLMSLTVIPISDLVIWLIAASRLAKASEHLTGVLILPSGRTSLPMTAGGRSSTAMSRGRRAHGRSSCSGPVERPVASWSPRLATGTQGDRLRQELHHAPEQRAAVDDRPRRRARRGRRRGRRRRPGRGGLRARSRDTPSDATRRSPRGCRTSWPRRASRRPPTGVPVVPRGPRDPSAAQRPWPVAPRPAP